MTWDATHRRSEVVRRVIDEADHRRDGSLPLELPGVAETFDGPAALVAALQLRWHTRLSGHIERTLSDAPSHPESAVLRAWRTTAEELPGLRAVLDAQTGQPADDDVAALLARARRKDWALLAGMAGLAVPQTATAARVGRRLEDEARAVVAA